MESLMILNCSVFSKKMVDIIKVFQQIGWDIYNPQGKVEYLPVGDNGNYEWQCDNMTESMFYDIISEKAINNEQIGVNLFYNNSKEGISLLAYNTNEIVLSLAINRRIIDEIHTDIVWYLVNIVYKFFNMGIRLISYKFEEFEC